LQHIFLISTPEESVVIVAQQFHTHHCRDFACYERIHRVRVAYQ
jgi:hypothetical protein